MRATSHASTIGQANHALWIVILAGMLLVQGFAVVWLNIERVDLAYQVRQLEQSLAAKRSHLAKLEVERDNLLAPARLRQQALALGLRRAGAGQIRNLEAPSNTTRGDR